jgi:hypothetical protein
MRASKFVDEFIAYLNIMELWILELESVLMNRSWRRMRRLQIKS